MKFGSFKVLDWTYGLASKSMCFASGSCEYVAERLNI